MKKKKSLVDLEYLRDLSEFLKDSDISELEIEKEGTRVRLKKSPPQNLYSPRRIPETVTASIPALPLNKGASAITAEVADDKCVTVRSPIVGTFFRSPTPGGEPYVNVGDIVKKGQIICIVEAMKLMNEIEAEAGGKIVEVLVEDAQSVEYGKALFRIEPV
ncbi:MAG: acetyl-CoA carboxylase biotin carboxyl carrier protein [Nitrospirae bacterium]|nr:acetyl-CoA carboxylase biotin carboxyl carrier protein [Nitrospirota bacterium]